MNVYFTEIEIDSLASVEAGSLDSGGTVDKNQSAFIPTDKKMVYNPATNVLDDSSKILSFTADGGDSEFNSVKIDTVTLNSVERSVGDITLSISKPLVGGREVPIYDDEYVSKKTLENSIDAIDLYHNNLNGIQGGTINEAYHLSPDELARSQAWCHESYQMPGTNQMLCLTRLQNYDTGTEIAVGDGIRFEAILYNDFSHINITWALNSKLLVTNKSELTTISNSHKLKFYYSPTYGVLVSCDTVYVLARHIKYVQTYNFDVLVPSIVTLTPAELLQTSPLELTAADMSLDAVLAIGNTSEKDIIIKNTDNSINSIISIDTIKNTENGNSISLTNGTRLDAYVGNETISLTTVVKPTEKVWFPTAPVIGAREIPLYDNEYIGKKFVEDSVRNNLSGIQAGIFSWNGLGVLDLTTILVKSAVVNTGISVVTTADVVITPNWSAGPIGFISVVYFNSFTNVIESSSTFLTQSDKRHKFILCTLLSENGSTVSGYVPDTYFIDSAINLMRDMLSITGYPKNGLGIYTKSTTDTSIGLYGGLLYYPSTNMLNDVHNPHIYTIGAQTSISFFMADKNGLLSASTTIRLDTLTGGAGTEFYRYFDNGTGTTLLANGLWQNLRVFLILDASDGNLPTVIIQRGQHTYATLLLAHNGVKTEVYTTNALTSKMILVGVISVRGQAGLTNTNDITKCDSISTGVWSDFGSGTGGTLAASINHNDLSAIQGGAAADYYHLTDTQYRDLTDLGDATVHYHSSDRNRANHTGTQLAATISDFTAAAITATASVYSNPLSAIVSTGYDGGTLFGSLTTTSGKWVGGVLAQNGKIYCAPYNSNQILEIDTMTQTTNLFGSIGGSSKYVGAVLGTNGKMYCIPAGATQVLEVDIVAQTTTLIGSVLTGTVAKYYFGVLAPNGKIYCIPSDADQILEINTTTGTTTLVGTSYTGLAKWIGGALGPNGKIYCIPANYTQVLEFDPATGTTTLIGSTYSGTNKWQGGVLGTNGKIYCIPASNTRVMEIDTTGTTTLIGSTYSGANKWVGGILAFNGKIYCIPYSDTRMLEIDPVTGTTSVHGNLLGSSKYYGGVLAKNGKIYGVPHIASAVLEFTPPTSGNNKWALGPYTNKF